MIPTAEQWINQQFAKQIINEDIYASKSGIIEACQIYAKLHCEAQLKAILEISDEKSIIDAYPLDNIK